jgi:hypothetical protein
MGFCILWWLGEVSNLPQRPREAHLRFWCTSGVETKFLSSSSSPASTAGVGGAAGFLSTWVG